MWQINNPAYGWGLLALVVPIIIHLYNRRQTKVKILGTLRWLAEVQPAQWNFRRIHQWPLLLIRMLVLTVVVLLLLDLYKRDNSDIPEKLHALILIHPTVGDTSQYRQLAKGWQNDSVKVHWLATGFPQAAEPITKSNNYPVWSLVAEANTRFYTDSIHIIAPNRQSYFTGRPPYTNAAISWELTELKGDSLRLLWASKGEGEPELLWFKTQADLRSYQLQNGFKSPSARQTKITWLQEDKILQVNDGKSTYHVPVTSPDTLKVSARLHDPLQVEWQLLKKAVQTIAAYYKVPVTFADEAEKDMNWLVNFSDTSSAVPVKADSVLMFSYKPGKSASWLEPAGNNGIIIRKELTISQILEGGFFEALRPYILAFKYKGMAPMQADFRRVNLAGSNLGRNSRKNVSAPEFIQPGSCKGRMWLGLLALGLITLERLWPKEIN